MSNAYMLVRSDEAALSEVFGLQITATPGHTKGHISVYDPLGSALIAGDALNNVGGTLTSFTQDMLQATESGASQAVAGMVALLP
jgi:glyoxylase-like metal-dependent hydrolase (beta-lactamase superfamily II)